MQLSTNDAHFIYIHVSAHPMVWEFTKSEIFFIALVRKIKYFYNFFSFMVLNCSFLFNSYILIQEASAFLENSRNTVHICQIISATP